MDPNLTLFSSSSFFINRTTTFFYDNLSSLFTNYSNTTTAPTPVKNNTPPELNPYFLVIVQVACILVLLLGIFGNTLVLMVFGSRWSKLKTCEVFMINLALSDLIGTSVVPIKMFLELLDYSFYEIGDAGCKIISFLSMTTITVSSLTLLVISIDRFIIVKWPLRNNPESWQIGVTIFITWFIAGAISFLYLLGDRIRLYESDSRNKVHSCGAFYTDKEEQITHTLLVFVVQIIIPFTTMTILYSLIVRELRRAASSCVFQRNERDIRIRLKRNRKATSLFVTIVTVFYILVLPSNIFMLFYVLVGVDWPHNRAVLVYTLLQMILMLNSCANPLIYSNLHTSFRRTTLKLLCSCVFKRFKSYQWGDSIRTAIRKSTRSVRESLSLHSFRARLGSDASAYNSPRTGLVSNRLDPSAAHRGSPGSPSQFSAMTAIEDVDHTSLREGVHRYSVVSPPLISSEELNTYNNDSNLDEVFDDETGLANHTEIRNGIYKPDKSQQNNHSSSNNTDIEPEFGNHTELIKNVNFKRDELSRNNNNNTDEPEFGNHTELKNGTLKFDKLFQENNNTEHGSEESKPFVLNAIRDEKIL